MKKELMQGDGGRRRRWRTRVHECLIYFSLPPLSLPSFASLAYLWIPPPKNEKMQRDGGSRQRWKTSPKNFYTFFLSIHAEFCTRPKLSIHPEGHANLGFEVPSWRCAFGSHLSECWVKLQRDLEATPALTHINSLAIYWRHPLRYWYKFYSFCYISIVFLPAAAGYD